MRGSTSAPTTRVLDVLELLAEPGKEHLRFSEIVRELGLTQATAHSILKTLCDRGWVSRGPVDKVFSLGPAINLVAARADAAHPVAHAARLAVHTLNKRSGFAASALERIETTLVITSFEGGDGKHRPRAPGDRIPYVPPFGLAFAAWDTAAEQRAWISRATGDDSVLAARLELVLARTRQRGFEVDWTTPALTQAAQMVTALPSDGLPPQVRHIIDQLLVEFTNIGVLTEGDEAGPPRPVATIAAPVFDEAGRVLLVVALHPLRALTMLQIEKLGRLLVSTATDLRRASS